jgi:cephalosporin hydroxylase
MWHDFLTNQERPIHKWTHYFPVYEDLFKRYQNRTCTILEIGCDKGGSLQLWKRYLGPYAQIVGVDINPECKNSEEEQIQIEIGSQSDPEVLELIIQRYAPFDIIIDDGSHKMSDIATTFRHLFQHVSLDGLYIVEDLHTAYWPSFEGGLGQENSFIEFSKKVIDAIHVEYIQTTQGWDPFLLEVAKHTRALRFTDSMIIYEKGRAIRKHAPIRGQQNPKSNQLGELSFNSRSTN